MIKFLLKLSFIYLISSHFFGTKQIKALVPPYYTPSRNNLKTEGLNIGKTAYQLLQFGQLKESLNLAKLAIKINKSDVNLWLILSEAQIANEYFDNALISLKKAEEINPNKSEIYFAKSSIYLKKLKLKDAKISLSSGLKISPKNYKALFQLGNIFLMEKNYFSAIENFDKSIIIKKDFWQAINNKGLAYFEKDDINLAIFFFKQAISISKNAEPILGLASCVMKDDINEALKLAKQALSENPNYVDFKYREEQLWGEKLQKRTKKLLENEEIKNEVALAKLKINKTY